MKRSEIKEGVKFSINDGESRYEFDFVDDIAQGGVIKDAYGNESLFTIEDALFLGFIITVTSNIRCDGLTETRTKSWLINDLKIITNENL